ncbi:MAG: DUF3990 domain-containing protein [Lachnospiraceae bacterium]|nr:DUF3990 domain-containing protein [Lachnospiraceae bacterium]
MILYHGSNVEVREPHLLRIQRELDFGKGFYTTSDFEQAKSWAQRSVRIRGTGAACVSCYEIDDEELTKLKILFFTKADLDWLEYVASNRKGTALQDDWDLIVGPVADDQTFPTILLYLDGFLDAESTIKRLLPQKLKDQYTFKTKTAIALLKCTEVKMV